MNLDRKLSQFGAIPFTHGSLLPLLEGYRRPNDKIAHMLAKGDLLQLRRGLYLLPEYRRSGPVSLNLLANLLYGPSCLSLDYALSWHGIIPETVHEITSVTPHKGRCIETPVGRFSYTRLPLPLYTQGIRMEKNPDGTSFLIATPEKALADKVALTRNLAITSVPEMIDFLIEDLRVDLDSVNDMDLSAITSYSSCGYKERQLKLLSRALETLR